MSADQHLWIADGNTQKILKYDLSRRLLFSWGTFGQFPGGFRGVRQFSVDSGGSLYTADVHVGRAQKFRPKPGATRASSARLCRSPRVSDDDCGVTPCPGFGPEGAYLAGLLTSRAVSGKHCRPAACAHDVSRPSACGSDARPNTAHSSNDWPSMIRYS